MNSYLKILLLFIASNRIEPSAIICTPPSMDIRLLMNGDDHLVGDVRSLVHCNGLSHEPRILWLFLSSLAKY